MDVPTVKLSNGVEHPLLGYGTYKVGVVPKSASDTNVKIGRTTSEVLKDVLEVGYRCLDCAQFYGNEAGVGAAIGASGIPREQLFIINKCWNDTVYGGSAAIRALVEQQLKDLQVEYIDLYLVHWPVPGKHIDAYKALEELHGEGKIRSIGLSNYSIEDYEELKPHIKVQPVTNQFEINPFLFRQKTINYFQKEGIVLHSYRTLRQGKEMDNPTLVKIAKEHGKTVAQVLGRWCVQQGIVYIPKSEKRERMIENAQVFDFELSQPEMEALAGMTDPKAYDTFKGHYEMGTIRDTPLMETKAGVKTP
eukprot:CAMPEP_0182927770 /NCGR_PEP_ID=MMETSP0105_2-20130417/14138_1 /TAXON_ID=81532 ORGANISM="Acanthoeca-like sp., Strain 10tr" /NCGR_SAMPLE_ID=MMETSP0105_2 /ASSEMBLY_ACC=CAM_ASM_000205 /LENGTH=305 /DNA_ID=CAMNT_0025065739 /DNA_START=44 /DNA_END=957 /DNA_ORIENTATION=+